MTLSLFQTGSARYFTGGLTAVQLTYTFSFRLCCERMNLLKKASLSCMKSHCDCTVTKPRIAPFIISGNTHTASASPSLTGVGSTAGSAVHNSARSFNKHCACRLQSTEQLERTYARTDAHSFLEWEVCYHRVQHGSSCVHGLHAPSDSCPRGQRTDWIAVRSTCKVFCMHSRTS